VVLVPVKMEQSHDGMKKSYYYYDYSQPSSWLLLLYLWAYSLPVCPISGEAVVDNRHSQPIGTIGAKLLSP
jgi:hypothetical protein